MKTEIQFLLELLLKHTLEPKVEKLCLARIGEVETSLRTSPQLHVSGQQQVSNQQLPRPYQGNQPASTQALLAKHGPLPIPIVPPQDAPDPVIPVEAPAAPPPPHVVAATPAAAQAVADRQRLMRAALSDSRDVGKGSVKIGLQKT